MTTSARGSRATFTPTRRKFVLGGASAASLALLRPSGALAASEGTQTTEPASIPFDFDNGNFIKDLVVQTDPEAIAEIVAPMDVTIFVRITHVSQMGWFDATAPYHPTAVGVYSNLGRRPASESETNRNKNIAGLHSSYRTVSGILPEQEPLVRQLLLAVGLDPDDDSEDLTTPVGIGNVAGKSVVAAIQHDGMNMLGDEGRKYHGQPYEDYTGYQPVNSPFELSDPSRWQPALTPHGRRQGMGHGDLGIFTVQHLATPQMRLVDAHTFDDPDQFDLAPPSFLQNPHSARYKKAVDTVLEASAAMTDEQKVMSEFFDNKMLGVGLSVHAAAYEHDLDLDGWIQLFAVNSVAMYDALIAIWHQKQKHDAVRPFSAVKHVYGSSEVTAWGGPGLGTVNDMPADEWASYLKVGDHPDYPSGSTTLCAAEAQATRRLLDSDALSFTWPVPAGSALNEPGITPAEDIVMHWDTWSEFTQDCAYSRVWGGVHFERTVEKSLEFGEQFGDLAYDFIQDHLAGSV